MTDERAAEMLAELSAHFHEPVMPVGRYCDALRTWARCIEERDGYRAPGLASAVAEVELQIRKSNLLARLIYGGEVLRTRECPIHKGRWSGIGACPEGCGETGWVPNNWPDGFPRCTAHPDRPAVAQGAWLRPNGEYERYHQCFACYEERWGARDTQRPESPDEEA